MARKIRVDVAAFHIIALFLGMAHAKGFAGQHTAQHNALKQIALGKIGHQQAHAALASQSAHRVGTVDIVHGGTGMAGQKMPHKCLGSANGQGLGGAGKAQRLLGTGFVHQRNGLLGGSVLQAKAKKQL